MAELTLVKRQLNAVITNIKRESKKAEELRGAENGDKVEVRASLAALQNYQSRLLEYSEIVLRSITDESVLDEEIQRFEEVKIDLVKTIAKLEAVLEECFNGDNSSKQSDFEGGSEGGRRSVGGGRSVRLPKLEIEKFSGNPMKFQEFWETFDTTINQNSSLAPVEKFKYLRSYLNGDALLLTEGYTLTARNYEAVVEVLKERFGDPELAIFCHLDALLAVQTAGNQSSELQKIYDECECHIRSLAGLGMPELTFGRVFVPILLSKIPTPVRVSLHQKKGSSVGWTLAELREMIRNEIYARDMGKRSFGGKSAQPEYRKRFNQDDSGYQNRRGRMNFATSAAALAVPSNTVKGYCQFCKGSHYSDQCRKYSDVDSRKKVVGDGCFNCLKSGHTAVQCRTKRPCFFCQRDSHHRSLCPSKFGRNSRRSYVPTADIKVASGSAEERANTTVNATIVTRGKRGVLQTAVADTIGGKGKLKARLLLDIGSDNTYATNKFLKRIGAEKTGTDVVGLAGFQNKKRTITSSPVHEMSLKLKNGDERKLQVYGTDTITCPIEKQPFDTSVNPILERLDLAEALTENVESVEIDILIGSDYYYDIVGSERICLAGGLCLLDSKLGYVIAGRIESDIRNKLTSMVASLGKRTLPATNFDLERFWKLEEIRTREELETSEDEKAMSFFNKTIEFDEGEKRYQVKWPWKDENPELPDNFKLCYGRLKPLTNRLQQNKPALEKYQKTIDDQLAKEVIEEVPKTDGDHPVHYIPHHGVLTPNKATTKLRVVYDASSKMNKQVPSLNECLYRGPVMLKDLCGLLIRFRLPRFAIISDLEKAFLQIGLKEQDRDVTRFLWLRDKKEPVGMNNLIQYRFRRVCFGLISSPFLLSATVAHHLNKIGTATAQDIGRNIYVDNIIGGVSSKAEGINYYKQAKEIFRKASMNLREFFTNSAELRSEFEDADAGDGFSTKVLGLAWNTDTDTFTVSVGQTSASGGTKLTKRNILRSIAQIFDPLGLFSPITTIGKILMQELWKEKYEWDDALPVPIVETYQTFLSSFSQIPSLKLTRHIGLITSLSASRVVLHCFSDASAKAYCAVVYLQIVSGEDIKVNILMSKSRVCPLKKQSIPRLELLSILIGSRLLTFVEKQLDAPVTRRILWSDSQCALHWVLKKSVTTTFVKNQVKKIRETPQVEFRYVPTKENPADIPTRGCKFEELSKCNLWWYGPDWLRREESDWPAMKLKPTSTESIEETEKVTVTVLSTPVRESVFDAAKVSTLNRMINIAVYVQRFIKRIRKQNGGTREPPTVNERDEAEAILVREAQDRHFADILKVKNKTNMNFVERLQVFKAEDGILRCSGRIDHAELPRTAKNPILLPKGDAFTALVVKDYHERLFHAGVKHTLAELRYRFWVLSGRMELKKVISRCIVCKRIRGTSFRSPPQPPLPEFRVKGSRAFYAVGLDYLGPVYIYSEVVLPRRLGFVCLHRGQQGLFIWKRYKICQPSISF